MDSKKQVTKVKIVDLAGTEWMPKNVADLIVGSIVDVYKQRSMRITGHPTCSTVELEESAKALCSDYYAVQQIELCWITDTPEKQVANNWFKNQCPVDTIYFPKTSCEIIAVYED